MKGIALADYGSAPQLVCACRLLPDEARPCRACRDEAVDCRGHIADPEAVIINDNDGGPDGDE